MSRRVSRLEGAIAARDLSPLEVLVDLVDVYDDRALDGLPVRTERRERRVAAPVAKGTRLALDTRGRVIPAEEPAPT